MAKDLHIKAGIYDTFNDNRLSLSHLLPLQTNCSVFANGYEGNFALINFI